ncbi:LptF/LptG family permease [Fulvivirgaceae bacterium LMO-SS25]
MKKIDKLVLGAFAGPFFLTLFIVVFILLTPILIRYGAELVGKDLGIAIILELFGYFSIKSTQEAIPLAILIASLIAFGNLGEHSEITAIKGAGISLVRILRPVFFVILIITAFAFYNNDQVVPKANLKAFSLLWDLKQKKPSLNLKEGAFYYDIPNFSIKAEKKYPDGYMSKILIYDHTGNNGNTDIIVADSGRMYTFHYDQYLMLDLYDGYSYSEDPTAGPRQSTYINRQDIGEFFRSQFDSSRLVFSLESFELSRTREELFYGSRLMKNIKELQIAVDSVNVEKYYEQVRLFSMVNNSYNYYLNGKFQLEEPGYIAQQKLLAQERQAAISLLSQDTLSSDSLIDNSLVSGSTDTVIEKGNDNQILIATARARREREERDRLTSIAATETQPEIFFGSFVNIKKPLSLDTLPDFREEDMLFFREELKSEYAQARSLGQALTQARLVKNQVESMAESIKNIEREANKYDLEKHGKWARAFTCIVMFLIGAPLGAIIKRGGLGMPILVSIGFFIFYYTVSIVAEKYGKEGILTPFVAVWLSNFILLPVGLFFLRQARIDARLFESDFYAILLDKFKNGFRKKSKEQAPEIESLDDLENLMERR